MHPHMEVYGGAETVVIRLAQYLMKMGIENTILTLSLSPRLLDICKGLKMIIPRGKHQYALRSTSFFSAMGLIDEIVGLRKLVHDNVQSFDVVNVHNFPATWSLFPSHKPCVWMCNEPPELWHNFKPSVPLKLLRDMGVAYDKVVVRHSINSICVADESSAKRISERYSRKSHVVHYGVDYDFFSKGYGENALQRFGLRNCFVLLHVGWITPQKNQLESIHVVRRLKSRIPHVKLVLAGLGENAYERMLKKYVRARDLDKHVVFTGLISKEVIRDLYHACDALISPVVDQGGWLAPFEAMCAEKPVVVSSSMTASALIQREKIGIIAEDYADAVWQLYQNADSCSEMSARAKRFVVQNLGWDSFGQRMLKVFEETLQGSD